ncbi:MAG: hypothetical protein U5O15_08920 [Candidatus Krumholzibacteriota bacterium]|nr:hypothetical protein [Candidatus Krumholzibacteriota bacterium]
MAEADVLSMVYGFIQDFLKSTEPGRRGCIAGFRAPDFTATRI